MTKSAALFFGALSSAVLAMAFPAMAGSLDGEQQQESELPCPFGWSVTPNPSMDNSLTYLDAASPLAVSVTSIVPDALGNAVSAEAYSRVAAEQMKCDIPVKSNLIEGAWSFECHQFKIEAVVYGSQEQLVLLAISGRNPDTEANLEKFIKFLDFEARK